MAYINVLSYLTMTRLFDADTIFTKKYLLLQKAKTEPSFERAVFLCVDINILIFITFSLKEIDDVRTNRLNCTIFLTCFIR